MMMSLWPVEIRVVDEDAVDVKLMDEVRLVSAGCRIREVRNQVRIEHLNIWERNNNPTFVKATIFVLSTWRYADRNSFSCAFRKKPGVDPCQGITSQDFRISEAPKDEAKMITE
jgi:hypothetical protein